MKNFYFAANAERVFIHPDYRENNNGVANVAVIQVT